MSALAISSPSSTQPSSLAIELLSITPEHLKKNGFKAKPWIEFFSYIYFPYFKKREKIYDTSSLPIPWTGFNSICVKLLKQLDHIPWNGKDSSELSPILYYLKILNILELHFVHILDAEPTKPSEKAIINHLNYLLLDRLSSDHIPNPNYFTVKGIEKEEIPDLLIFKEKGNWELELLHEKDHTIQVQHWGTSKGLNRHAILTKESTLFHVPFFSIVFTAFHDHPAILKAKNFHTPVRMENISDLPFAATVIYCTGGSPSDGEIGNSITFLGSYGPKNSNKLIYTHDTPTGQIPDSNDPRFQQLSIYANLAVTKYKAAWLSELQTTVYADSQDSYITIIPQTEEECTERILATLELALEAPEENAHLIEWISNQYDFDYSEEEIQQAEEVTATIPAEDEKIVSPAIIARAIIQRIKKTPLKQQKKQHTIDKPSAPPSKKPLLSKEELKEQLEASHMNPKQKELALGLLSGKRLTSKREEDKFFLEMLTYQAQMSDSSVQTGNSNGSHHSIRLIRQDGAGGKSTYRAATLVNKHGADANRGHSLSAQQNSLLRLFTPLA